MTKYMMELRRFFVLFILAGVLVSFIPSAAMAAPPPPPVFDLDVCNTRAGAPPGQPWHYTSKVVSCLKTTVTKIVLQPGTGFLAKLSDFMRKTVGALIVFAIMAFAIRITSGEQNLRPKAIGFLLRLGLVWLFSYNLGNFGNYIFQIMDEMICLVALPGTSGILSTQTPMGGILPNRTGAIINFGGGVLNGCYPWNFMDLFVGKLFGFGEHILLTNGLLGIVAAALFSSTMGMIVFLTGFMAFMDIIFMILRVIFVYLSSVLVVAFMIIVSPLIIPLAIFYTQERYFKKWLDILLTAMFIPMMLFAFVGMFLGIYDLLLDRIINILGGVDAQGKTHFDAYWRLNQPKFSWLMPADPNIAQDYEDITRAKEVGSSAIQAFINPYARRAVDTNLFVAPGVDFGPSGEKVTQQLVLGFLSLWIFSSLMKSMIKKIPEVTQSIIGASLGITYQSGSFESGIKNAITGARDEAKGNLFNRNVAPTPPASRPRR